ncbi:hypothetical protein CJ030_MR5G018788 [Morella rubra]|uniref:Uncharacterized protein n=1 Tax=Morella rubra TaxID=262757 RepID=A0A6A1VPI9_9ROSI|nr:hypothetical protein CJ030_MR5G018788 [Morella rubra]
MVEAFKPLTERSSSSASVQSTLVANQEVLKLDLMKLVADVGLIRKHLKLMKSSIDGSQEDPLDSAATAANVEEEDVKEEDVEEE